MNMEVSIADAKILFENNYITQQEFEVFMRMKTEAVKNVVRVEVEKINNPDYSDATIQMK